ncbi:MAG TPA: TPM domain-containing protein, partial [Bryobacteraceae bacterium]|nr:TPM domain-containing protein [Bryobacteraceae bacterium]
MKSFWGLAALLCAASPALAVDWKTLKPQGYVSDFANVVDAGSRAQIEDYAARVQQATGAQLAFVTLPSLQGEPIEDVTNDIFHNWGVGRKKEDDGAMVLLSVGDRKSRLEVGGGLGGILPDGMAGMLLDDMRPALRQGQYGEAMLAAAQRLGSTIAQSKGVAIPGPALQRRVQKAPRDSIPWPIIFVGIFILLAILRRGGRGGGGGGFWSGLLLGQLLNS